MESYKCRRLPRFGDFFFGLRPSSSVNPKKRLRHSKRLPMAPRQIRYKIRDKAGASVSYLRSWVTCSTALSVSIAVLFVLLPASAAAACPRSDALAPKDVRTQYRLRGDRCEGIYAKPVSTTSRPRIVGFHRQAFPNTAFTTTPTTSLTLLVRKPASGVSIRAVSLRPRTYYAMDTDLPPGRSSYAWQTSILSSPQLALSADELGVVACDNLCLMQPATRYFPVELAIPASRVRNSGYVLIFQSEASIERATLTLQDAAGKTVVQRVLSSRYVGSWPIPVGIGQPEPGSYRVRLAAEASDGTRLNGLYTVVIP